jgi:hypothetical protein
MKRRTKRFDVGGLSDEEGKKDVFGKKYPEPEEGMTTLPAYKEKTGTSYNTEYKEPTFKEAYAAARKAGKATFEFNGKKISSDLKKPAPKVPAYKAEDDEADEARMSAVGDKWRESQKDKATVPTATPKELERRKAREKEQALEEVHPESAVMPGPMGVLSKVATATRYAKLAGEPLKKAASDVVSRASDIGSRALKVVDRKKGGSVKAYSSGGSTKTSASSRGDGIAQRGKTRGQMR